MSEDAAVIIGEPMSEEELDELEHTALIVISAIKHKDYDTAYIAASMCVNPPMLAMFIAETMWDQYNKATDDAA